MSNQERESLSQGEVYDLLSNARRRFVISYLRERDEPVELSDLSREVAAWENETAVENLTDQQVKRVYVSLYQTHVPKLDDSGIVDYDQDSGEVRLTSSVAELDTYLPERDDERVPWQLVYAGIAGVGLLAYVFVLAFPGLVGGVTTTAVGVAVIVAFGVAAAAHYLTGREL
ncbi:DUF7344 domain-containing protein [Halobacterium litoreum]|uniref:DUF7344 domain-containing protein n=1 Tax=Halobacterium litoreum TaxID=2039234 RepID=A0ABD5NBG5_9EURY|nr:hypothetical protein [Halobacterium litoreum]UHH14682.1 hypothetical protein LT972_06695 [Halobacterium litoreum]